MYKVPVMLRDEIITFLALLCLSSNSSLGAADSEKTVSPITASSLLTRGVSSRLDKMDLAGADFWKYNVIIR